MSLSDEIAKTTRDLALRVLVDATVLQPSDPTSDSGVPGVASISVTKNLDAPVPVASVGLNRIPSWITRGRRIAIDLGYNGIYARVFTGTVQDRGPGVRVSSLNCAGNLWQLFRGIEIAERDIDGLNVKVAIEAILDDIGLKSGGTRDTADIPTTFTLGSASDAKLRRQRSSQMVQTLMELEGVRAYEDGNGVAHFKVIDATPAGTAFKAFSTDTSATARIIGGGVREDPTFTRTRVTVNGATVLTGVAPDETSSTLTAIRNLSSGDIAALIKPPLESGQHIDSEVSNSLADTQAQVDVMAERLLTEFARIPKSVTVEIPGDPQIDLAQTLAFEWPELGVTGNWFVYGVTHRVDESGFRTTLDLRGGEEYGISIEAPPVASFEFTVDRQVFGDRVQAVVTFDASGSYDPDGTTLTYAWADDETTSPDIAGLTTSLVTVRIDPAAITGTWTVTLTVTDADGNTSSFSREVDVAETASLVKIPAIYGAIDNNESATPDGGLAWNDQADVGVISVGARPDDGVTFGHAIFGTSDGKLLKTTDSCASALTEVHDAGAVRFEAVAWDWRDVRRVWALDDEMTLYVSTDGGDSFVTIATLRTLLSEAAAIGKTIGLPGGGGVWVYGGDGANNPMIAYSTNSSGGGGWRRLALGGELGSDLPAQAANVAIVDATDKGDGSGLVIVLENADDGAAPAAPLSFQQGSYVGNGTNQDIGGLNFRPKVVIIQGEDASFGRAALLTDTLSAAASVSNSNSNAGIDELRDDGFGVTHLTGDDMRVNASGITYHWFAFGGSACQTGSYTGDGESLQGITGLGGEPDVVNVRLIPPSTEGMSIATNEMNNKSVDWKGLAGSESSVEITSLDPDGFGVGAELNADGSVFHYWALMPSANLQTGSYNGDGNDNREVPAVAMAFDPDLVWLRAGSSSILEPVWTQASMGADQSFYSFGHTTLVANHIQDLTPATSGKFEIGDDAHVNSVTGLIYYFWAVEINDVGGVGPVKPVYHTSSPFTPADWERGTGFASSDVDAAFVVGAPGHTTNFIMAFADRAAWKSDDGVAWTEVADVLPANHVFRHAIWGFAHTHNFFLASFYLAAVEDTVGQTGGIYKSTDEFTTALGLLRPATGFDTWPASAIGRQVAIGRSQASEARLVVAYVLAGPASRGASWRASTVDFSDQDLTGAATTLDFFRIRALTDQLWFITWFDSDFSRDTGEASRTKDGGTTWDDPLASPADGGLTRFWGDFGRTSDDRLWAFTVEDDGGPLYSHTEIWVSDDDGDTWTESHDDTDEANVITSQTLVVHPTNANRIAVFGLSDALRQDANLYFTTDGGTTWNQNTTASNIFDSGTLGRRFGIMQLTSNRFVMTQLDPAGDWSVFTSDDNGAVWTKRQVIDGDLTSNRLFGPVGEPSGSRLYIMLHERTGSPFESQIWESIDGGISWTDLANNAPIPAATDEHNGGLAYDPVEKALYVYGAAEGDATNIRHIMKLFPVSSTGIWTDMSDTIVPASGRATYSVPDDTTHGIAVIPRP